MLTDSSLWPSLKVLISLEKSEKLSSKDCSGNSEKDLPVCRSRPKQKSAPSPRAHSKQQLPSKVVIRIERGMISEDTHKQVIYFCCILQSHWFYTKVINVCKNTSVRKINQVYSDSVVTLKETTFECFRINIKSSVLLSFPNTSFFDCRPVTSKQLWL